MKEPYTVKENFKIRLAELGIKVTQKDGKDYADLRLPYEEKHHLTPIDDLIDFIKKY